MLHWVRGQDPDGRWDVRGTPYEVVVAVVPRREERPPTLEELVSLLERGFTLGSSSTYDDRVMQAYARHGGVPRGGS